MRIYSVKYGISINADSYDIYVSSNRIFATNPIDREHKHRQLLAEYEDEAYARRIMLQLNESFEAGEATFVF